MRINGAPEMQPEAMPLYVTRTLRADHRAPPGNKGFVGTWVIRDEIDSHNESHDINFKKGQGHQQIYLQIIAST